MLEFSIGNESIDHQINSKLGPRLEEAIRELKTSSVVSETKLNESPLAKVIKEELGIIVEFVADEGLGAWVLVPDLNHNNVLMNKFRKQYFKDADSLALLETADFLEGTIDLRTGKVSGDFAKVKSTIGLGNDVIGKASIFTVPEITGILLHEIGHIDTYLELLGRFIKTSNLLDDAVSRLLKATTKEQRTVILSEVEKATKTTIDKKDEIAEKARTADAYAVVILSQAIKQSKQELDVNIYDARTWEQLADQFAARYGYAVPLVTGLDKIHRLYGSHQYRSPGWNIFCEIFKLLGFILIGLSSYGLQWIVILLAIGNPIAEMYDPPKDRFRKIKQQLNDALKDKDLPAAVRQKHLDDFKIITEVMDKMYDNETVYNFIWSTLFPWGRKQAKSVREFQETEALLNNDLFAAAALVTV